MLYILLKLFSPEKEYNMRCVYNFIYIDNIVA